MGYLEDNFEQVEEGSLFDEYIDEANERRFWETPETIVRLSKIGDSWSVSEHTEHFFEIGRTQMLVAPERFDKRNDAMERVKELIDAHR
jgi:predicted DNA-binding WGR domain protein